MSEEPTRRAWLKPAELAKREGVDQRTIRRWVEKGIVQVKRRAPRVGVRYRLSDYEDDED